ncbi:LacI family DNA-binding transcriptional regulator [Streptomyces sp. IBSBF 2435]|uniref:LacI family DNA-binding transcriptional regulator n=1 Tax=Streptomyces sp. IBSBF 2435 TaxID=2903531 RepID=UPI002FDBD061
MARRAGVSAAAVSLAFSGKPGVSPATRRRIEAAAAALDWQPGALARLMAAGTVALAVPAAAGQSWSPDPHGFVAGAVGELSRDGRQALLARAYGEPAGTGPHTLRQCWQEGRICGAVLYGGAASPAGTRVPAECGLPVVTAAPPGAGLDAGSDVWWDDRTAAHDMVGYLAALGHRRIAYVADGTTRGRAAALHDSAFVHQIGFQHTVAAGAVARSTRILLAARPIITKAILTVARRR